MSVPPVVAPKTKSEPANPRRIDPDRHWGDWPARSEAELPGPLKIAVTAWRLIAATLSGSDINTNGRYPQVVGNCMDQPIETFLAVILALAGEHPDAVWEGGGRSRRLRGDVPGPSVNTSDAVAIREGVNVSLG
jgi:hypothetical protein